MSNDERIKGAESPVDSERFTNAPTHVQFAPSASVEVGAKARQLGRKVEDPYIGATVADRYRILDKLGEGGMGVVYLAEHVFIERKVALKILTEDFARRADLVARFMQEAKAASKIGHENIVDVTDFGELSAGSVFFAMEYLPGGDLASHIREGGPMSFHRARPIMKQVCRALEAAHSKGIVHRDMKPENIFLIEREGKPDFVKILDFGIAKMNALDVDGKRLTRTGMIFGTPEYMSPEQARGDRSDHRVDIYAAGCILYELLTGDVPFRAATFMGVLTKQWFEQPESPSKRTPNLGITKAIDAVVLKALAKDRDQRFQSMRDMALALERCADGDVPKAWSSQGPSGFYPEVVPRKDAGRKLAQVATAVGPAMAEVSAGRSSIGWHLTIFGGIAAALALAAYVYTRPTPRPIEHEPLPRSVVTVPVVLPNPPPMDLAPVEKQICRVSVKSIPPGAEIWNGDERIGVTPLEIDSEWSGEGIWTLRKKGFLDHSVRVNISSAIRNYQSTLTPARKREKRLAPAHAPSLAAKPDPPHVPITAPAPAPGPAPPATPKAVKVRDLKDPFSRSN